MLTLKVLKNSKPIDFFFLLSLVLFVKVRLVFASLLERLADFLLKLIALFCDKTLGLGLLLFLD